MSSQFTQDQCSNLKHPFVEPEVEPVPNETGIDVNPEVEPEVDDNLHDCDSDCDCEFNEDVEQEVDDENTQYHIDQERKMEEAEIQRDHFLKLCDMGNKRELEYVYNADSSHFMYGSFLAKSFCKAYEAGHYEVAEWIKEISGDKISLEFIFNMYIKHDTMTLEDFKFYQSIGTDIQEGIPNLFVKYCFTGQLEAAQYIYENFAKLIDENNMFSAFTYACDQQNIQMAQWLGTINPDFKIDAEDNQIFGFKIDKYYEIAA
jgi:hypothetical protein